MHPVLPSLLDQELRLESIQSALTRIYEQAPTSAFVWLAFGQIFLLLSFWLCSLIFARKEHSWLKNFKLWILNLVGFALTIAISATGLHYAEELHSDSLLFASIIVGLLTLTLVLFGSPMLVYDFNIGQSFGFAVIALTLAGAGHFYSNLWMGRPIRLDLKERLTKSIAPLTAPVANSGQPVKRTISDEALMADRSRPLADRRAAAEHWRQELATEKAKFKPGEESPAYLKAETRYRQLLRTLNADSSTPS